ncbi:4a-hydroxytetrahydrobiopterin dehydratase [Flavobacterium sp.]|uniref:4a-hydroxytetrahydrobiopterin dehydratase n=1 Tax=Flavobacterium sp. TaxID=239 RepID=UPI0035281349
MKNYTAITAQTKLATLKNWTFINDGITKTYVFTNFSEALAFIIQVGLIAEKLNHHPDWTNSYNKVFIRLTTYDSGGVTDKDFELALEIDKLIKD